MYELPSPEGFKNFLKENNLTAARAAALTGVNLRTVQRWTAPAGQKGARTIPWAAWALIRILTGNLDTATLLLAIEAEKAAQSGPDS
jgi:hypothetical protein